MISSKQLASVKTPSGNTGLKLQDSTQVLLDWFQFTLRVRECDFLALVDKIGALFGETLTLTRDKPVSKGKTYSHSIAGIHGFLGAFEPLESDLVDGWISLPGGVLRRSDFAGLLDLFSLLKDFEISPTRLDIALDDFKKSISFDTFVSALESGSGVGFSTYSTILNNRRPHSTDRGWTVYCGSRASDKFIRYYNKSVQSGGEIDSYRLEVEFKRSKAHSLWQLISTVLQSADNERLISEIFLEAVIGCLDFRDRAADSNISRCPQLSFWTTFINHCRSSGGIKIPAKRVQSSLTRTVDWINNQVQTSISLLLDIFGDLRFAQIINTCALQGRQRYSARHLAIIRAHKDKSDPLPSF